MTARLANLRRQPAVFRHLTGLTVEVFDELAAAVVPAAEAAHREALDRPGRCCWPVRTLRVKDAGGRGQPRTPAMAAGRADRVWPLAAWLALPGVQR